MKLVKVNITEVKRPWNDNHKLLQEFENSNEPCMEVVEYTHKHAKSCHWSLSSSVRRFKMFHIHVVIRKGRVYLINTLLTKELTAKKAGS